MPTSRPACDVSATFDSEVAQTTFNHDGAVAQDDLVQRAVEGCREAFAQLADYYRPRILHLLQRRFSGTHAGVDAEDVTQTALARAFENIDQFDPQYKFSTWLYTIAFHVASDHWRRHRRWTQMLPMLAASLLPPKNDPTVHVETLDQVQNVWAIAQASLTADQYAALWLRFGEGLDVDDIAKALDKSPGAVRVLLHRSRLALLERLT